MTKSFDEEEIINDALVILNIKKPPLFIDLFIKREVHAYFVKKMGSLSFIVYGTEKTGTNGE